MKTFETLRNRFDDIMSAVTFAEAGEFETARLIMNRGERPQGRKRAEKSIRPKTTSKRAVR